MAIREQQRSARREKSGGSMIRSVLRGANAPSNRWAASYGLVTLVVIGLLGLSCGVPVAAHGATTTTIQVAPCEVPDETPPRINPGDAPVGFGPDSWQGPPSGTSNKSNWHVRYLYVGDKLTALFPTDAATMTIADLA